MSKAAINIHVKKNFFFFFDEGPIRLTSLPKEIPVAAVTNCQKLRA